MSDEQQTILDQVVALRLQEFTEVGVSKALNITRHAVSKIVNSEAYKKRLNEIRSEAMAEAASMFMGEIAKLRPLVVKALKKNLENDNMEAVRAWARFAGLEQKPEGAAPDTSLTIVMPGAAPAEKPAPSIVVTEGEEK